MQSTFLNEAPFPPFLFQTQDWLNPRLILCHYLFFSFLSKLLTMPAKQFFGERATLRMHRWYWETQLQKWGQTSGQRSGPLPAVLTREWWETSLFGPLGSVCPYCTIWRWVILCKASNNRLCLRLTTVRMVHLQGEINAVIFLWWPQYCMHLATVSAEGLQTIHADFTDGRGTVLFCF